MAGDYFFSKTKNSGGSSIKNVNGKLPVNETKFHTPGNSLELNYKNVAGGNWEAIIYRQQKRGMDHFKKAEFLSFWIYNTSENELPFVQLLRNDSSLSSVSTIPPGKVKTWQRVIMPLASIKDFDENKPGNGIALVFSQQSAKESKENTIYIDDIEFLPTENSGSVIGKPAIISATGYAMHIDILWEKPAGKNIHLVKVYRSENGKEYKAVGIQQPYTNRYADFVGVPGKTYYYKISFLNNKYEETKLSVPVTAATKKMTDDELLTLVEEASFRYYWEGAESTSGLARENIPAGKI